MGNQYGKAYSRIRSEAGNMKRHTVSEKDIKGFSPEFIVASSYPKRLIGVVEIFSDLITDSVPELVDTSRVNYRVVVDSNSMGDNKIQTEVFRSFNIYTAIEFYNNL